jgi:tetratricopeptide (TPR) repeat protein
VILPAPEVPSFLPQNVTEMDLLIANRHVREGRIKEAMDIAYLVLTREPNNSGALFVMAWCFIKQDRPAIAYSLLKRSLEEKKRHETWNNLGMACIAMQKIQEAEECFQESLRMKPDFWRAANNLALVAVYETRPEQAIEFATRAIELNPEGWESKETLGYAHLMLGNFAEGWKGYESMLGHVKQRHLSPPYEACPYWQGESNLDLYVSGEQGLGDEISFASCLPDLLRDARSVSYECHPKLVGLMRRSFPSVEVHGTRAVPGTRWAKPDKTWREGRQWDAYCLSGTLAATYRKSESEFPGTAYLKADPERRIQWRALLDKCPGLKVGIAWTGGTTINFKERRSLALEDCLPLLRLPGVTWVSLEWQDPSMEIELMREQHGIEVRHWPRASESDDYDDQAALVSELDLVITVTNSMTHLCGALGVPAWVLVPQKPNWFFGLKGRTSPWYQSVEYFRQVDGEWPMEELLERLRSRSTTKIAA